jgi:hypothetical protein
LIGKVLADGVPVDSPSLTNLDHRRPSSVTLPELIDLRFTQLSGPVVRPSNGCAIGGIERQLLNQDHQILYMSCVNGVRIVSL